MATWFYRKEGENIGPVDDAAFQALLDQGIVVAETFVWQPEWSDWKRYGDHQTPASGAVAPPPSAPAEDARPEKKWHQKTWFRVLIGVSFVIYGAIQINAYRNRPSDVDIGNCTMRYWSPVEKNEAWRTLEYLAEPYGCSKPQKKGLGLDKEGDRYQLKFVVKPDYLNRSSFQNVLRKSGDLVSENVLNGSPVDVHLVNRKLETVKLLPGKP